MKRYWVGEPVQRKDGRYDVPIHRIDTVRAVPSQTVCIVNRDAFVDLVAAQNFAYVLCDMLDHAP